MNRVGWALAFTCLLALVGLSGRGGSCAPAAHADEGPGPRDPPRPQVIRVQTDTAPPSVQPTSPGFDPANASAPPLPEPADATSNATAKSGCNAIPFVLPFIGVLGLLWLRMKKTMK